MVDLKEMIKKSESSTKPPLHIFFSRHQQNIYLHLGTCLSAPHSGKNKTKALTRTHSPKFTQSKLTDQTENANVKMLKHI